MGDLIKEMKKLLGFLMRIEIILWRGNESHVCDLLRIQIEKKGEKIASMTQHREKFLFSRLFFVFFKFSQYASPGATLGVK